MAFSFIIPQDSRIPSSAGFWSAERIPAFNIVLYSIPGNKQPQAKKMVLRITLLNLVLSDLKMVTIALTQPMTIHSNFRPIWLFFKKKQRESKWFVKWWIFCVGFRFLTEVWKALQIRFGTLTASIDHYLQGKGEEM